MAKHKRRMRGDKNHASFVPHPAGKEHASGGTKKKRTQQQAGTEERTGTPDDFFDNIPAPTGCGTGGAGWAY